MNKSKIFFAAILAFFVFANSCKRDEMIIGETDYPKDIAYIMLAKCAIKGCHIHEEGHSGHTGTEKELPDFSSWSKMFEGSQHSGALVIPYRADYSSLMYFVNTYPDLGPISEPTMPKDKPLLSRAEVIKLKEWINAGAPDSKGNSRFSGNLNRKKYYVINQGCRVVTVFDAETNLPMRYVDIADASEQNTSPHQVRVSPDGQYWYVCYIGGSYIKRYKTTDDTFDGKIFVGNASWNTITFTPDSKFLFAVDWAPGGGGKVVKCDLQQMKVSDSTQLADSPHGSAVSPDGKNLFITATGGNYLYKIHVDSLSKPASYEFIDFDGLGPTPSSQYNPHEILFSPDGSKYYVTCSGNNNTGDLSLKVFTTLNDLLASSVSLPSGAYEMSISQSKNLLFVTSYESTTLYPDGQVMVVDLSSNTFVNSIETGAEPHGIAVDEAAGLVYVANRNLSGVGHPHHSSVCGGSNGSVVFIDLNTLQVLEKEVILSRDPYFITIRF